LSTVRIYKVAELLNTTSQEVMALLKRDHGIEVKSASSTIEEVVARQFVERLARQRSIQLPPTSAMFIDTPAPPKGASSGKKGPSRAPEPPPKPAAPTLGPPRLVKTLRPAATPATDDGAYAAVATHEGDTEFETTDEQYADTQDLQASDEESFEPQDESTPAEVEFEEAEPFEAAEPVVAASAPSDAVATASASAPDVEEAAAGGAVSDGERDRDADRPVEESPAATSAPAVAAAAAPASAPPAPAQPAATPLSPPLGTLRPATPPRPVYSPSPPPAPRPQAPVVARPQGPGGLRPGAPGAPRPQGPPGTMRPQGPGGQRPQGPPSGPRQGANPIPPPIARPAAPTGRVVPPTLRLRIEDPNAPGSSPAPAPSARPAPPRQPLGHPRPGAAAPATGQAAPSGTAPIAARPIGSPGIGTTRTPSTGTQPAPLARPPLGGPRPLPSAPVRPSYQPTPGTSLRPSYQPTGRPGAPGAPGQPARPGQPPFGARPGQPSGPPPQRPGFGGYRPGGPPQQRRQGGRPDQRTPMSAPIPQGPPPVTRTVTLAEGMTVKDLADKLEARVKDVLKKLIDRRMMMTINTTLDTETATLIARDFGADVKMQTFEEEMLQVEAGVSRDEDKVTRAPVVTVMGHVDHGKTTLLDAIRETRVAEREAGGITQHIGAYSVKVNDRNVVFLDTPGHEAFTMMRARGAKVTDVVILVVAADDGVMPQTREAIDHARAAAVPIIVALNKIDKPEANPDRVKRELSDLGLMPEEWGGTTVVVGVSAKKRQNLDALLEMVLLVADLADLKANPKRAASGTVLEAKLDRGRGPVATVLVQDGSLHVGDTVIAGTIVGKIRALIDDRGRPIKTAGPSTPVEVLGLGGLPAPGDTFQSLTDAAKARQIALFRQTQVREKTIGARSGRLTLESLQQQIADGNVKELPVIIKADVQGSAEVLADTLTKLSDEKVKIRVVHAGVGAINESDVLLASTSNAIIIGFNTRPNRDAADLAEREKVDLRMHSVIYHVTDEIKKAMTGLLEPTFKEVHVGTAEVRQTFRTPKFGTVAGCMVTDGRLTRSGDNQARLLRDHVVVHEGKLGSLRRFKDDVSEVKTGFECGLTFDNYNDLKVGDTVEVFIMERIAAVAAS
jgi:translation initiation factor IF-2